jgi:transposase
VKDVPMSHAQAVRAGKKAALTRKRNAKKKHQGMTRAQAKKKYGRCPKCGKKTTFDKDKGYGKGRVEINCPTHGRIVVFDSGFA